MPNNNGKYTESDIHTMPDHEVFSAADSECSDFLAQCELARRRHDIIMGQSSSGISQEEFCEIMGDLFSFMKFVCVGLGTGAVLAARRYCAFIDKNFEKQNRWKMKLGAAFMPIVALTAPVIYSKYVSEPLKAQRIAAQNEQMAKQAVIDEKKNDEMDLNELNSLDFEKNKEILRDVFKTVMAKKLPHHVIVTFSEKSNDINVDNETSILLPPARQLQQSTSLYVCASRQFADKGKMKYGTDCSYFSFSTQTGKFSEKIHFVRRINVTEVSDYMGSTGMKIWLRLPQKERMNTVSLGFPNTTFNQKL